MSKELIFSSEEFNDVRTAVDQNGTPLFCAHDVAKALGYSNFKKAIRTHCMRSVILKTNTSQGLQDLKYIPEPDVYRLIMRSKLPAAQKFEKMVYEEILPSIRKTGGYLTREKLQDIYKDRSQLADFLQEMTNLARNMANETDEPSSTIATISHQENAPPNPQNHLRKKNLLTELST
ncbi:MAG: Bro-N domain-containing protein [Faecalibacterium sp.]